MQNIKEKKCLGCLTALKEENPADFRKLQNRLSRIGGQVKGLQKMMENGALSPDLMIQVAAVNAALHAFNKELVSLHLSKCLSKDVKEGNTDVLNDFIYNFTKMMR